MIRRRFGVCSISAVGAVAAVAVAAVPACGSKEPGERLEQVSSAATTAQAVLTQHNNISRTGAMLAEPWLVTGNVNPTQFGRIGGLPVRGSVVAQPLFVPNVNVNGTPRNLVYVATMRNLVYAFRADFSTSIPIWSVWLGPSINLPDPEIAGGDGYHDIAGEVGIVSTPVILPEMNAMFVVAATKEGTRYVHRLHRLDLSTGADQKLAVEIAAPGFQSQRQNQRPGLLLTGGTGGTEGVVYIAFASYGDYDPYHGWVVAYDAATLQRKAAYQTTTTSRGGIWMAGSGPAADSGGAVYVVTGNGAFAPASDPLSTTDLGDSVIRLVLDSTSTFHLSSWFSPQNNSVLNDNDGDFGSSGPMLIPGTSIVTAAGKEGKMYLLQRDNMGYSAGNPIQQFFVNKLPRCPDGSLGDPNPVPGCHHIHGSPVFWDGPMGSWLYVWSENEVLKAFRLDRTVKPERFDCQGAPAPDCDPVSMSTTSDPDGTPGGTLGMPGGFLSLSANGNMAGSGIVWALHPYSGNANQAVVEGIMRAYDASNLGNELWNTKMNADRDDLGPYAKGSVPTIADGRVYADTYTGLSRKVQLADTSNLAPTLSIGSGNRLYLGWTGTDGRLNVMSSTNGRAFGSKVTRTTVSNLGPTLAGDAGQTYLGWIGTDRFINVVRTTSQTFATVTPIGQTVGGQTTFPSVETSNMSLGLAVGNGRVYVAWTGDDRALNLMSAPSGGGNFDGATKVTFNEQSLEAPNLTVVGGVLYLSWTGTDGRLNIAALDSSARNIASKRTLDEISNSGPSLAGTSRGGDSPDLHVFWSGTDSKAWLKLRTADSAVLSTFNYKLTFSETSQVRPAAAIYGNRVYLAWRGDDDKHSLNLARYNPGEVNVYGLLH